MTAADPIDEGPAMKGRIFSGIQPTRQRCISATTWARCATGCGCRTSTSASSASSTCTRSPLPQDPAELRAKTREVAAAFIAAGLDPEALHHLRPEPRARARPARLDLQLRHAARLAQPHDPVQGQGRQAPRERLRRPLRLPGADGRRHPGLQGHPRAGRRGPEAASRAGARHRAALSTATYDDASSSRCPSR